MGKGREGVAASALVGAGAAQRLARLRDLGFLNSPFLCVLVGDFLPSERGISSRCRANATPHPGRARIRAVGVTVRPEAGGGGPREARVDCDCCAVLLFGNSLGLILHICILGRRSKSVNAFHSENENSKFTAILDAAEESGSKKEFN